MQIFIYSMKQINNKACSQHLFHLALPLYLISFHADFLKYILTVTKATSISSLLIHISIFYSPNSITEIIEQTHRLTIDMSFFSLLVYTSVEHYIFD